MVRSASSIIRRVIYSKSARKSLRRVAGSFPAVSHSVTEGAPAKYPTVVAKGVSYKPKPYWDGTYFDNSSKDAKNRATGLSTCNTLVMYLCKLRFVFFRISFLTSISSGGNNNRKIWQLGKKSPDTTVLTAIDASS